MSAEVVVVVVLAVVLAVALTAALLAAYLTAHRLDRLHIRTDLARAALVGALERRHTVAASIARQLGDADPGAAARLWRALADARAHPPDDVAGVDPAPAPPGRPREREAAWVDGHGAPEVERAENALGVVLAGLDPGHLPEDLAAELDDVTDRVAMARRFYNDAVRDTRALREKASVRALRLAGRAPLPDYVELVDPGQTGG